METIIRWANRSKCAANLFIILVLGNLYQVMLKERWDWAGDQQLQVEEHELDILQPGKRMFSLPWGKVGLHYPYTYTISFQLRSLNIFLMEKGR